ncbi:hypothetical protein PFISCL1PPCAC_10253 [Pristionchus fissidentatus]|uniref:Uncharacterized protein n=1 Tax=Pristionchus fissidentatus TaxID=1538716 RepID=A0AAV5VHT4_9BILA|nr:hypothetical protein PFISCL1PPCAC_10253 [Pristionchus fissidentatus]
MAAPAPPSVDFVAASDEYCDDPKKNGKKVFKHFGVIVSKTGHDRGQKEMYLYSPTVRRSNGKIVCSSDFFNFEVGEWIYFTVDRKEAYCGGMKCSDPYQTGVRFDFPQIKVRACMYPSDYTSIVCRQQTRRCWSPDLGDLCIDPSTLRYPRGDAKIMHEFETNTSGLYYVTASYSINASIFNDCYFPDNECHIYWNISSVEGKVLDMEDIVDYALVPWRRIVADYLSLKYDQNKDTSNAVPPWYIRSPRILSDDMVKVWEDECKNKYGLDDPPPCHYPIRFQDGKVINVEKEHPEILFKHLKVNRAMAHGIAGQEGQTTIEKSEPWKPLIGHDGKMLGPGSKLPPVSVKKKEPILTRHELVQDSAGLFMSSAAALSYVEIKESGEEKLWTTGGWKKKGEAWDSEAGRQRWDKNIHKIDDLPFKNESFSASSSRSSSTVPSKNLLSGMKKMAPRLKSAEEVERPNVASSVVTTPVPPKPSTFSFARAVKEHKVQENSSAEELTKSVPAEKKQEVAVPTCPSVDQSQSHWEEIIDPLKLDDEGKILYEKYKRMDEYVRETEKEASKEPSVKGYTAAEYIKAQKGQIQLIRTMIKIKGEKMLADSEKMVDCNEKIQEMEERLRNGEVNETELVEIHLSIEDDADMKEDLREHVAIKKELMDKWRLRLIENQKKVEWK